MVRPERFELPACCFGGNRSIQLSYGRVPPVYMDQDGPAILASFTSVATASTTAASTAVAAAPLRHRRSASSSPTSGATLRLGARLIYIERASATS